MGICAVETGLKQISSAGQPFLIIREDKMKKYIIKRLISLAIILFAISLITFALLYIAPGDPAEKKLAAQGMAIAPDVLEATRENMGLNRPFIVQYFSWLGGIFTGDMGTSYKDNLPVSYKLGEGLKLTIQLAITSILIALGISIPLGIFTAVKKNSVFDTVIQVISFLGNSLPSFLISVLLIFFLCVKLKMFPIIANNSFQGLFLPAISLAIPMTGSFTRQFRAEILEQLNKPFIIGCQVRGVKKSLIIFKNVFYNSISPIATLVGMYMGGLMGGSVIIETMFRWPGIGKLVMDSIEARDYPVIQGFVLIMATIYVFINLGTDIIYRAIDPRIELE